MCCMVHKWKELSFFTWINCESTNLDFYFQLCHKPHDFLVSRSKTVTYCYFLSSINKNYVKGVKNTIKLTSWLQITEIVYDWWFCSIRCSTTCSLICYWEEHTKVIFVIDSVKRWKVFCIPNGSTVRMRVTKLSSFDHKVVATLKNTMLDGLKEWCLELW